MNDFFHKKKESLPFKAFLVRESCANVSESSNYTTWNVNNSRLLAGISLKNNFPSKDIHYFQCDNHPEYHYPHCKKIPDVPKVTGLDIFRCNKLYDDKETDEREDKEYLKVDTLRKEHEDRD